MPVLPIGDLRIHWVQDGNPSGDPVILLHALGTDHRLFDRLIPHLPPSLRLIRPDMRGHGGSSLPAGPGKFGTLVLDVERLMDQLALKDAVVAGVSVGGMMAQALAAKRPGLVRALVLANTAVKIGTPETWAARIATVRAGGMQAIAAPTLARWFGAAPRDAGAADLARQMLLAQSPDGYVAGCEALAGADLIAPTSGLRLPALVLAGTRDGSTPPDLVRELAGLIPGATFRLLRGAGHLSCLDAPREFADAVTGFLAGTAPLPPRHPHLH